MPIPTHEALTTAEAADLCRFVLAEQPLRAVVVLDFAKAAVIPVQTYRTRVPFLMLPLSGRLGIYDGSGQRHDLMPGQGVYYVAGSLTAVAHDTHCRFLRVTFDEDYCFIAENELDPDLPHKRYVGLIRGLRCPGPQGPVVEALSTRLHAMPTAILSAQAAGFVSGLLSEAIHRSQQQQYATPQRSGERWRDAIAFMRRNCWRQPWNRQRVADAVGVHPHHLTRLLRQHCGKGFNELINEFRLERAERLLRDTNLNLDAIARDCGYRNGAYFGQVFKRHHGVTPGVWRRQEG